MRHADGTFDNVETAKFEADEVANSQSVKPTFNEPRLCVLQGIGRG